MVLHAPLNKSSYPLSPVSHTVCAPAGSTTGTPLVMGLPSTNSAKSPTTALPPLSFVTTLVTVNVPVVGGGGGGLGAGGGGAAGGRLIPLTSIQRSVPKTR